MPRVDARVDRVHERLVGRGGVGVVEEARQRAPVQQVAHEAGRGKAAPGQRRERGPRAAREQARPTSPPRSRAPPSRQRRQRPFSVQGFVSRVAAGSN